MRKQVNVLIILLTFALLLVSCGGQAQVTSPTTVPSDEAQSSTGPDNSGETTSLQNEETEQGFQPIEGTPAQLSIFAVKNPNVAPFDQLKVLNEYAEQVGVEISWENPPAEDGGERFNLIVASGSLPDMFWTISAPQYNTLYGMKALAPLKSHIEAVAPNLQARMAEYPNDSKYFLDASTDEIYMLPFYDELTSNNPMAVRGDWLEKLNLEEPVTIDDWVAVWRAIKDGDPNGNGEKDEIPFSTSSVANLRTLVAAWGMLDQFYVDVKGDGKIHYSNTEPKYKEFLSWLSQMYEEGLIDSEVASTTGAIFQGKVAENIVGSFRGTLNGNLNSFNTTIGPKIEGFNYIGTVPIQGPDGDQIHPGCASFVRNDMIGGVVSISSKVPEVCVAFCDAFYDKGAGTFIAAFGEEGVSYTLEDGKPILTDYVLKNTEGQSPMQVLGSECFLANGPAFSMSTTSFQMWNPLTTEAYQKIVDFYDESIPYVVQALPFTSDEDAERRALMADITTYVDESVINFMTGDESLDNFDAYAEKINSMGLPRVLELYNTAFARWSK